MSCMNFPRGISFIREGYSSYLPLSDRLMLDQIRYELMQQKLILYFLAKGDGRQDMVSGSPIKQVHRLLKLRERVESITIQLENKI